MTAQLIFATNNPHKLDEVRRIAGSRYTILSLNDIGFCEDIPETAATLEGNALLKARAIAARYRTDCFADDTGLEVSALNNAPGVYSARYAGEGKSSADNRSKLLQSMSHCIDRTARFRTVIALIREGKDYFFEGVIEGVILREERGNAGFGYDSLFLPKGYDRTFAEMDAALKNSISHRAIAVGHLIHFLHETH
jgi:XTP/dITP diphosphohydrolase